MATVWRTGATSLEYIRMLLSEQWGTDRQLNSLWRYTVDLR